jgi:hypothetical protein
LTLTPLLAEAADVSLSAVLAAAGAEVVADFDDDDDDDEERLPPRPASLVLERVISSAAITLWITGLAFMDSPPTMALDRRLA